MEPNEINTPQWKTPFLSEFSMGPLDFQRYNKTLDQVDLWCAIVNSTDVPTLEMAQNYFAHLVNWYDDLRPLLYVKIVTEQLDDLVNECKRLKRLWENDMSMNRPTSKTIKLKLIDNLGEMKRKLYDLKQKVGLGIVVKRNMSTKERIRKGVRGDNDFSDLPEA